MAESALGFRWLSFWHGVLLWLVGQASVALLWEWRKRGAGGEERGWNGGVWLGLHVVAAGVWIGGGLAEPARVLAGGAAFGTLALGLLPVAELAALGRRSYWAGTALGACGAGVGFGVILLVEMLWWGGMGAATIEAVTWVLRWFDAGAGHSGARLQAFGFGVRIEPACSGFEGMVLIAVFTAGWLAWFRKEYRFPRALVLIPLGVVLSWCLNVLRLAVLMWIGSVAGRSVALGGFHSQAGWILFTGLAMAMCAVSLQVRGLRSREQAAKGAEEAGPVPVTAWLVPFAAIQAAAMVSMAARTDLEWLYPLRTVAGVVALGWFWRQIPRPKFDYWSGGLGLAIAVGWGAITFFSPAGVDPFAKLTLGEPWLTGWTVLRVVGAAVVVPVAEELAFRGILQGRFGLFASSVSFGLLHGSRWLPGILAGLALGWLKGRRGLGESIAAHVTANVALLVVVWLSGDWRFW